MLLTMLFLQKESRLEACVRQLGPSRNTWEQSCIQFLLQLRKSSQKIKPVELSSELIFGLRHQRMRVVLNDLWAACTLSLLP